MSPVLTTIGLAFIVVAGLVHILIFLLESVLWRSRSTWRQFGIRSAEDAEVVRPWALNQGFYNLFLAAGAIAGGVGAIATMSQNPGWVAYVPLADATFLPAALLSGWGWIAIFSALCMLAASIVLVASSRARLLRGALMQGLLPLVGIVLVAVGLA